MALIPIKEPTENASDYINRKGYTSISVQATCNHNYRFIDVVANCLAVCPLFCVNRLTSCGSPYCCSYKVTKSFLISSYLLLTLFHSNPFGKNMHRLLLAEVQLRHLSRTNLNQWHFGGIFILSSDETTLSLVTILSRMFPELSVCVKGHEPEYPFKVLKRLRIRIL